MQNNPFKEPKRPWHRKRKPDTNRQNRYDTKFYKRTGWQKVRQNKLWQNPYCEVSEAYGYLMDGEHVDHIIPRSKGGSDSDPRNLMTLTEVIHNKKSAMERVRGCLVATRQTPTGLIPVDRDEVIAILGRAMWGKYPDENTRVFD